MAAPPSNRLQSLLQNAVQTVQWTYSLFWQLCPQQGMLVWGDGCYNGAIKTRKTVQSFVEVSVEEDSIQRSRQLIELYESLSAGESINNQQTRWPCAALSPEDLTESEWFYLMCVSFSFPLGVGLPGKAYAKRQHIWLIGANEVDSKVFSRAILAKSANIQTVVCIPLPDGVLELGSTERVQEDIGLIHQVKSLFNDHHPPQPPKPALSGHSTSNSATLSELVNFCSPPLMPFTSALVDSLADDNDDDDDDDDDEEEEEGEQPISHSVVEPSELIMKLDMSEDIRLGSPDDGDSNFQFLFASREGKPTKLDHQRRANSHKAESTRKWPVLQDPLTSTSVLPPPSETPEFEEMPEEEEAEDTHYSQTLSTILQHQHQSNRSLSSMYSSQSAFSNWTLTSADRRRRTASDSASQWLLKYILFTVPFLHAKEEENSPTSPYPPLPQRDEGGGNHVLAERRRREKLNERFVILRSLVPFVTKMDKASILGDTIEYVKQLRNKVADLEARVTRQHKKTTTENQKRKLRIVEEIGSARPKPVVVSQSPPCEAAVQVSIIESNVLVEIESGNKEGLLLDVMVVLREFRVEVTAVQSSVTNGVFVAELRAKVRENVNGKKPSIVEVKKAIEQIIPQ